MELNDREEVKISPSWIEKSFLHLYSLHIREKPSKSNLCAKRPYINSWLMAHIALKSNLKARQAKAAKEREVVKIWGMEAQIDKDRYFPRLYE